MDRLKLLTTLTFVTLAVFAMACGPEDASESSPVPPIDEAAEFPPDHPPLDPNQGTGGVVPPPAGSGSGSSGLTWSAAEHWVAVTPSSNMRKAQYEILGDAGAAELVVFYFGPGQGGDAESNVARWVGEFAQPDGSDSSAAATVKSLEVSGLPVTQVAVTGIYSGGGTMMGGGEPRPGYMLVGAIAQGPDANWFFKFTGPEETVQAEREAFASMLESLRIGG